MCQLTPDLTVMFEKTVRQFLDQNQMFTGFDLTKATRDRERQQIRHQDVRGGVHELQILKDVVDFGHTDKDGNSVDWERTLVTVVAGQPQAFVYHPKGVDPHNYVPNGAQVTPTFTGNATVNVTSTPSMPSISAVDGTTADTSGQSPDGTFCTDYRNRLLIPTKFLKAAGIQPNDQVQILPDAGTNTILVSLVSAIATNGLKSAVVTVERNGDVRISATHLRSAGIENDDKFVIENTQENGVSVVKIAVS